MPDASPIQQAAYESFDGFLKHVIKEYYVRRGKTHPVDFAALLIASGQTMSMGIDSLKGDGIGRKIAVGAAGAVALRVGLKYALAGPLGIIATGLTAASMGSYMVKNYDKLGKNVKRFRTQIGDAKRSYESTLDQYRRGRFTAQERNLMLDGLMHRVLQELLTPLPDEAGVAPPPEEPPRR